MKALFLSFLLVCVATVAHGANLSFPYDPLATDGYIIDRSGVPAGCVDNLQWANPVAIPQPATPPADGRIFVTVPDTGNFVLYRFAVKNSFETRYRIDGGIYFNSSLTPLDPPGELGLER